MHETQENLYLCCVILSLIQLTKSPFLNVCSIYFIKFTKLIKIMKKSNIFLIFILLFITYVYPLKAMAGGGNNEINTTTVATPETNINTTSINNTGTTSDLNTNLNRNTLNQGVSAFNSSFSGYSSFSNQCGLSISGGYLNNNGNQDAFQLMTTFNTNPCTNQIDLESIRQENENKREIVRANTQIIMTCINARTQAVQNNIDPDMVCTLKDFQMPKSP